ncbi:hypothetical protein CEK25_003362 [Fusarium fujikuroi]|nr:hypothetical protein CEK25_003362 [Fusarium fujikuroi]
MPSDYCIPDIIQRSGDTHLLGVEALIFEGSPGHRAFIAVNRYNITTIPEFAAKSGRPTSNGCSRAADASKPTLATRFQASIATKELWYPRSRSQDREQPPTRGSFEECRQMDKALGGTSTLGKLAIRDTAFTFEPVGRMAKMLLFHWEECAKPVAAMVLDQSVRIPVDTFAPGDRCGCHLSTVGRSAPRQLTVIDMLRLGHLDQHVRELTVTLQGLGRDLNTTSLQLLATDNSPVIGSSVEVLQKELTVKPSHASSNTVNLQVLRGWPVLDPWAIFFKRPFSIHSNAIFPGTVDLSISLAESDLSA